MNKTTELVNTIIEGIQEKKGQRIVVADLDQTGNSICQYFIICQGNSTSHVSALAEEVREYVCKNSGIKPEAVDGLRNAEWVAMDYSDIIVHLFLPETRAYYDLEHLWADAGLKEIPDLN